MSSVLIMAAITVGLQAQTIPPPPSMPSVHGYVHFNSGSAVPIRQDQIDPVEYLGRRVPPDSFVYVRGQTDTVGSDVSNVALSRRRAFVIADLLARGGVNPERMTIMSCGERVLNRPTSDDTPEPLNRSVTFDWSTEPPAATPLCRTEPYRR